MEHSSERFQLLSLDGGGIKGLFSAAVLAKIEEDLQVTVAEHFDLIAGTSTGGIIALGMGLGLRPREIVEFYVNHGPKIFGQIPMASWLKHWFMRKYSQGRLVESLRAVFGDKRLADCKKRLVIPSYSLSDGAVYLFKTPHHDRLRRDFKVPIWKVALSTSSAPTYFPPCCHVDQVQLVDGGVWANNPVLVGIAEAVGMLEVDLSAIHVLSLGTSQALVRRRGWLRWGGKLLWAAPALDVIMQGQSVGAHNQACHLLGKDRVERINPLVPDGMFDLDKLSVSELLAKAAHVSREFTPIFSEKFKGHRAPAFSPLYS